MPRSHEGKSARHWPFSQKERGHAAVPSAQRWQGAPISGQSESLAQAGDSAGRQKPGQSAPALSGAQSSFGASAHS